MVQDYCTPVFYAMLRSCLWALYPRIAALILGFCVKLSVFWYTIFLYFSSLQLTNMVLMRIFGPRTDEVMGEWRRLNNEELNDLYSSPNIVRMIKSRRMRWAGHVVRKGEERGVYRVLLGKPEGRRLLGRPRHR